VKSQGKASGAVRDFGARGDGQTDATEAIQATIDAARAEGNGAVAYLPAGTYATGGTLRIEGADYALEGSGFRCGLVWRGEVGQTMVEVSGVRDVTIAHIAIDNQDQGAGLACAVRGGGAQRNAPGGGGSGREAAGCRRCQGRLQAACCGVFVARMGAVRVPEGGLERL
jgi:hypothetical protein